MSKNKTSRAVPQSVLQQPTFYTFDFKDVPTDKYADTLSVLFANPDFSDAVGRRNRIVQSASRLRAGSSEMSNILRTVQQHDRKLADIMYQSIVQTNIHSEVTEEHYAFSELLKYFVDYRREGIRERVDKLARRLDSITFLSDMLESILVDIRADMRDIFDNEIEFRQFDAVQNVLTQLRGFFRSSRSNDEKSPSAQLYFEYSDSINEYIAKRLKTYTEKYRKLHPTPPIYDESDYLAALNQFFGEDFGLEFISHSDTGGAYINGALLLSKLPASQVEKLKKAMPKDAKGQQLRSTIKYDFAITEAVMNSYKKKKKG